jgi:hypothetical protein
MHSCVFLASQHLDNFGQSYLKSIAHIPKSFQSSKSSYQHLSINNIYIGNTSLANFNSTDTTYSLINSNCIDKNLDTIRIASNAKNVRKQYDTLDNGDKVVTITLTNGDGDMRKVRLYSTTQPDQCALNDVALSASPIAIYINNQGYFGYFKNRFEYDVYVPTINDVNISAKTSG